MQVALHKGRLELTWPGVAATGAVAAHVLLAGGRTHASDRWRRSGDAFATRCGPLDVELRVRTNGSRARLDLTATARGAAEVVEVGLRSEPLVGAGAARPDWIVYSGYQSWDASGVTTAVAADGHPRHSWWTCGLAGDDGCGLAFTALAARRATTRFDLTASGALLVTAEEPAGLQRHPVLWHARAGKTWRADPLLAAAGADVQAELKAVAGRIRGRPASSVPQGWLSWYHYGPWVSEEDVLANAAALDEGVLGGLGYSIVQVDDGWQELYGDWVANAKFPGGLRAVAERVGGRGQVLGVWTAPFLVASTSQLAREAPDSWFVQDPVEGGRAIDPVHLVFGPMHVLDARNPGVRRHLTDTFRQLRADGVRYFKIDFLYAGGYAGTRALRAGVEAIREGVGDDAYLLACGAPLLPMVGLCEGCRIGRDTATPIFDFELGTPKPTLIGDEIAEVARNQAARHFLDSWFQLDPDVALVGGNLTIDQAHTCVAFCALSGGPFFASDDLTSLEGDRLQLLQNRDVLALVGGRPAVPDWMPSARDRAAAVWRRDDVVAVFNWNDAEQTLGVGLPAGPHVAVDLWTGAKIGAAEGRLEVAVPPLGARLIRLSRR